MNIFNIAAKTLSITEDAQEDAPVPAVGEHPDKRPGGCPPCAASSSVSTGRSP
ncbi:MAG: hypothetical protein MZU79_09125 [Anaerotruncus sp.]|nr:hypothetical protein [Anaerotruncus sp.]